jgi:hypothetical protein
MDARRIFYGWGSIIRRAISGLYRWRRPKSVLLLLMSNIISRREISALVGIAPLNRDSGQPLGWTVNCLVCHMAEIDGVAYFGAGTKTFDDLWLGTALKRLTSDAWRTLLPVTPSDDRLAGNAHRILTSHHHDKIDSLTRARSTAFAASHVELFLRPNGAIRYWPLIRL